MAGGADLGLDLRAALDALATRDAAPAGGSAAALVGAIAAAVTVKVARISRQDGFAAQAVLAPVALGGARADRRRGLLVGASALAESAGGGDERRDFSLGVALDRASAIPLEIAEACADVAALAGELARTAEADAQPDAAVAAVLAAAAAHAAVRLVEVNLAVGSDDPRADAGAGGAPRRPPTRRQFYFLPAGPP